MSHTKTKTFADVRASTDIEWLYDVAADCAEDPAEPERCPNCLAYVRAQELEDECARAARSGDPAPTRAVAQRAVAEYTRVGVALDHQHVSTLAAAARAYCEQVPASDADLNAESWRALPGEALPDQLPWRRGFDAGWRACERALGISPPQASEQKDGTT